MLRAVVGERKEADRAVLLAALDQQPSLVLDCANAADIHALYRSRPDADFTRTAIQELELLYKYRDCLAAVQTEKYACVSVTSTERLFHYGDVNENIELYAHIWSLLATLGKTITVMVAVPSTTQQRFAQRARASLENPEDVMGHTIQSQRNVIGGVIADLQRYAKALPPKEQERVHRILHAPLQRAGSISYANSLDCWAFVLLTIIEMQERRIEALEHALVDGRVPA